MAKISILYFSKTSHTKEMANVVSEDIKKVTTIEVGVLDLNNVDDSFLLDSKAVFI
ncbi:hypothetical protein ACH36K_15565 [Clostridium sp. MB05]|uniref:hypothetical protein n=1 Tax=Clostridium sp. MB05 TaxID=3376682 RepID=UPI003981A620